jgi:hypothetical protein
MDIVYLFQSPGNDMSYCHWREPEPEELVIEFDTYVTPVAWGYTRREQSEFFSSVGL